MKKLIILSAIALSGLMYNTADAQIGFHAGFRFRPRVVVYNPAPVVAPAVVYEQPAPVVDENDQAYTDTTDEYYYLPDVDAYYDVADQCYFYYNGYNWISAACLPGAYANYDWRSCRRFEVRSFRPYLHDHVYRNRYNGERVADWSRTTYSDHFNNGYANQGYNRTYNNPGYNKPNGGYNQPVVNRAYNRPAQPYRPQGQQFKNKANTQPAYQNANRGATQGEGPNTLLKRASKTTVLTAR